MRRKSDIVLDGTIVGSTSLDVQPSRSSCLLLTVSGISGSGTIEVTGVVDGVTTTESFSFTSDGFKQSINEFTSVTGITSSGFTSGNLRIQTVTPSGQPVLQESVVTTSLRARFTRARASFEVGVPGVIEINKMKMLWKEPKLQHNDIIVDGSTRYVLGPPIEVYGLSDLHHYSAVLDREEV